MSQEFPPEDKPPEEPTLGSQPQTAPINPREALIDAFKAEVLEDPDRLAAILGGAIADVFSQQLRLHQMILEMYPHGASAEDVAADFVPALNTVIKFGNFSNQQLQVLMKWKASRPGASAPAATSPTQNEKRQKSYPAQTGGVNAASNTPSPTTLASDAAVEQQLRGAYHVEMASARASTS